MALNFFMREKIFVRSGIRTHAHRSGLRPERSALDRSAILTHEISKKQSRKISGGRNQCIEKDMEDPGIDPGTSRMLSERSTI